MDRATTKALAGRPDQRVRCVFPAAAPPAASLRTLPAASRSCALTVTSAGPASRAGRCPPIRAPAECARAAPKSCPQAEAVGNPRQRRAHRLAVPRVEGAQACWQCRDAAPFEAPQGCVDDAGAPEIDDVEAGELREVPQVKAAGRAVPTHWGAHCARSAVEGELPQTPRQRCHDLRASQPEVSDI